MRKESIVGIEGSNGFVGCGFAVTPRHILTCAHVVNAALADVKKSLQEFPAEPITVVFPYLEDKQLQAKVVYWKPEIHDIHRLPSVNQATEEDIAGLELLEEVSYEPPVQVDYNLENHNLDNVDFIAFGYPKKTPQGAVAQGKIQAAIPFGWVQIDGSNQEGFWVAPGYSGTAIWGLQDEGSVYGMMVAVRKEDEMADRIAYMIPCKGLKRAIEFLKLLNELPQLENLDDKDELWRVYQFAYEQCQPPDWKPDLPIPETPSSLLAQVDDMGQSELKLASGKAVERTWEFLARFLIHAHSLTERQKQSLRDWGKRQCSEFLELIDRLRQSMQRSGTEQKEADPCLMVEVSPNQPPYNTRAFFIPDAHSYDANKHETWKEIFCWNSGQKHEGTQDLEPFDSSNWERVFKARLSDYIRTCEKKYQKTGLKFRLELILPLSLMNAPIECQQLEYSPYRTIIPGSNFPIVIRSYDRTTEEYLDDLGGQWQENWQRLQKNIEECAHACLADVSLKVKVPQLAAAYIADPKTVGFKLSEVLQKSCQEKFLATLLGSATPVALWLRHVPKGGVTGENPVQKHLQEFLECNAICPCTIGKLLNRVLRVRADAIKASMEPDDENFMVGHHLSLLWENPKLLPPIAPKIISE